MIFLLSALFLFSTPQAHSSEIDFQAAFQKEYAFLVSQKDSLARQKQDLERQLKADLREQENQLRQKEKEFAELQAKNEALFELVQEADKRKRDEANLQTGLTTLWGKARRQLAETNDALHFQSTAKNQTDFSPSSVAFSDLIKMGKEAIDLLDRSSRTEEVVGVWKNPDQTLKEGKILRFGRVAALGLDNHRAVVLGPDGEGFLRIIEEARPFPIAMSSLKAGAENLIPLYLFQDLREKVQVKKVGGAAETMADLAPALFLALLFGMVGFLFYQLARI